MNVGTAWIFLGDIDFETNWQTHTPIPDHPLNTGENTKRFEMNPLICVIMKMWHHERPCFTNNTSGCSGSWEISETKRYKWHVTWRTHHGWKHHFIDELLTFPIPRLLELFRISIVSAYDVRHRTKKTTVQYGQWPSQHTPLEEVDAKLFPSLHPRRPPHVLRQVFSWNFHKWLWWNNSLYKMFKYK